MSEQSNEEIRVKVAEILGYKIEEWGVVQPDGTEFYRGYRSSDELYPNWPEDPAAALTLCDRLREEGWVAQFNNFISGKWSIQLCRVEDTHGEGFMPEAADASLPRAIAIAFLKAKENNL